MITIKTVSATKCPHCGKTTESGTHNGCGECHKVKHSDSGRRLKK